LKIARTGNRVMIVFKQTAMVALLAGLDFTGTSQAITDQVAITSYDVNNTQPSGYGSWSHTYNGSITGTGLVNETGGSGTLNDGSFGASEQSSQLFSRNYLHHRV
jgi:hypothetical protein